MICTELEDTGLLARLGQSDGPRTRDVLHVSDIYKRLMIRLQPKRFDKRDKAGNPIPMDLNKVEIGLLFERMLERALAEKFATERPGEIITDEGIYLSPDGVNPELLAGEEYKATFMSSRDGIFEEVTVGDDTFQIPREKFLHWFIQMKAYAKWLSTRVFLLRVLFICGDYTRPFTPQFRSFRVEFSDEEIEDNWTMLIQIAREEGLLA